MTELTAAIVHLGSRCFYDLFENCYFFVLNRYASNKTKTTRQLGIFFSKFSKKVFLIFFDKTHESMGLYNGKTTTTMPLLCCDPHSVDGETSGFGTASNHD